MNALKAYMAREKVTQRQLAAQIDCTQGLIHQWVSGLRKIAAEKVIAVSFATGWQVTPHQLRPDIYPNPTDGLPAGKEPGEAA
jgi:DNA-binding transcriptional regulator YdaS (Cro superfamily)